MEIESDDVHLVNSNGDELNHYKIDALDKTWWKSRPRTCIFLLMMFFCIIPMVVLLIVFSMDDSSDNNGGASDDSWADAFSVYSDGGVAVTDNPRCSQIGADILEDGGNAIDAAVAAALCLGVLSPASSGLGGGCFILTYNATSAKSTFIDSREVAPAAATEDMFVDDPLKAQWGGLAVAVPAELRGLYMAWETGGGNVSWSRIVEPAASLAEKWEVSEAEATYIASFFTHKDEYYELYPDIFDMYSDKNGNAKQGGDFVENPALAETLRHIAQEGPDYLYVTMAATLAEEIVATGGIVTTEDISSYTPLEREVMTAEVWGHTFMGAPPPSSGGLTIIAIMQYLAGFSEPVSSLGGLYYHRLVEGMKHAFAIRMSLGDPAFVNVTAPVNDVLYNGIMDTLRQQSNDNSVLKNLTDYGGDKYGPVFFPTDHGTSHLSIIDKDGNAVSLTSTINTYFGSGVMSRSTGLVFNNEMDDFSIPSSSNAFGLAPFVTNYVQPGKRPLSSMSPTIVTRTSSGKVRVVGGASGGPRIITSTAQVILNYLARGMSLVDAMIEPRIHSQLLPDVVYIEDDPLECWYCDGRTIEAIDDAELINALQSRGHVTTYHENSKLGVCQFAVVDEETGEINGVSDPRKGGSPAAAL